MSFERCWVIGAGVMGTSLAAVLHLQAKSQVHLVGSSPHLMAIKQNGLIFEVPGKETQTLPLMADLPREVPDLSETDLVVLCGKATGLGRVAEWLATKLKPGLPVLAMQNGMGFEQELAKNLGCPVERGLFFMGARSPEPGRVRMFPRVIALAPSGPGRALAGWLEGSGIKCDLPDDFQARAWFKLAVNCVANPLAGILDSGNRHLIKPSLDPVKDAILNEVRAVARAEGVVLDLDAVKWNGMVEPNNTPSLHIDLQRGVPTEIDYLNGAVVRFAQKHGLTTPVNRLLVDMVHFLETKDQV